MTLSAIAEHIARFAADGTPLPTPAFLAYLSLSTETKLDVDEMADQIRLRRLLAEDELDQPGDR